MLSPLDCKPKVSQVASQLGSSPLGSLLGVARSGKPKPVASVFGFFYPPRGHWGPLKHGGRQVAQHTNGQRQFARQRPHSISLRHLYAGQPRRASISSCPRPPVTESTTSCCLASNGSTLAVSASSMTAGSCRPLIRPMTRTIKTTRSTHSALCLLSSALNEGAIVGATIG